MAKGKQAALAARRRAESAHEVIDRLTSDLAEAKLRARLVEAEARHVPTLTRHVEDLSARLEAACSVEVERLRDALARQQDRWGELVALIERIFDRVPAGVEVITVSDLDLLERLDAVPVSVQDSPNRELRRSRVLGRTQLSALRTNQDNRRSAAENLRRKNAANFGSDPVAREEFA